MYLIVSTQSSLLPVMMPAWTRGSARMLVFVLGIIAGLPVGGVTMSSGFATASILEPRYECAPSGGSWVPGRPLAVKVPLHVVGGDEAVAGLEHPGGSGPRRPADPLVDRHG